MSSHRQQPYNFNMRRSSQGATGSAPVYGYVSTLQNAPVHPSAADRLSHNGNPISITSSSNSACSPNTYSSTLDTPSPALSSPPSLENLHPDVLQVINFLKSPSSEIVPNETEFELEPELFERLLETVEDGCLGALKLKLK